MTEQKIAIILVSPHPKNEKLFNKADSFTDVELVIGGMEQPLCLHRSILGEASNTLHALFMCKQNAFGSLNSPRVEWMFGTQNDMTYHDVLVKWLRFCYGADMHLNMNECAAALAALNHLQLTDLESMKQHIVSKMIQITKNDLDAGIMMLRECAIKYDECHEENDDVSEMIAKVVLTKRNIVSHKEATVDKLLMELPSRYLDLVEYCGPHEECSSLNIRMMYIERHEGELSEEEKRDIINAVPRSEINSEEADRLWKMRLIDYDGLFAIIKETEKNADEIEQQCEKVKHVGAMICSAGNNYPYYWDSYYSQEAKTVAQAILAACYYHGFGREQDKTKALSLWSQCSQTFFAKSILQQALGEEEKEKADGLYEMAALLGSGEAAKNLGLAYADGIGVEQDFKKAFVLLQQAADLGTGRLLHILEFFI